MRFLLPLICGSTLFIFSKIAIILFLLPVDIYIYVILTLGGVMQQVCVLPCGYVFILHCLVERSPQHVDII